MEYREPVNYKENTCSFSGIRPAMADLPYPPIRVREENMHYADLLSMDYCGPVSELSAITQYINNENRLALADCALAKTLLGIAIAEMMHLQKLGELICLLGKPVDFQSRGCGGKQRLWTPDYLTIPGKSSQMLAADIESEQEAISQYKMHMREIRDEGVNAVLQRIILDEEYHIMLLESLR